MNVGKPTLKVIIPLFAASIAIAAASTTAVIAGVGDQLGDQNAGVEFHEREMVAGAKTYKKVQTAITARTTSSTAFSNLTLASVPVAAGRTALINVKWAGETACYSGGAESNFCSMRVVIGGVEGHPQAGINFAIDSTDGGTARADDWEGHVIERHRCVRNGSTSTVNIPVSVDWAVTNVGGGTAPVFRVDDWALDIQRADNCSPLN